ncbi:hypothetical protein EQK21_09360 [Latilactobacillus curvatus]|nr:hypothetical protein EQK21_09360 [Latilactobacillus curvatus]
MALKEDDIDFEKLTLTVDESYDSKHRTIPISSDLANILRNWIMYHRQELFK